MTRITIEGDIKTLLTHCALWGTAALLANDLGSSRVRAGWVDADGLEVLVNPRAVIEVDGVEPEDIGAVVKGMALMVSSSEHWASQLEWTEGKKHVSASLLTPRTGLPKKEVEAGPESGWWQEVEDRRSDESAELSPLEQDLVRGLGMRSWWLAETNKMRPDLGASPWEMKTRNRGEEFLAHRFLPLAREIAQWSPRKIVGGLTGYSRHDVVGKNSRESRVATGLAPMGPCDNALAWCALWAFSMLQPVHQTQPANLSGRGVMHPEPSVFPGRLRAKTTPSGQEILCVAVPQGLVSVKKWQRFQRTQALVESPERLDREPAARTAAQATLRAQGVPSVYAFQVLRSGSSNAPERRAQDGQAVML